MHAEKCPICGGSGKTANLPNTVPVEQVCHGCGGRGWVEVGTSEPVVPIVYVPPYYWPYYLRTFL